MKNKLIITALCSLLTAPSFAVMQALNTAATGMESQEKSVGTISNNIANLNTTGFKKERVETEDLMYQTFNQPGARSSSSTLYNVGLQVGTGSKVSAVKKDFGAGSPLITGNPFDFMINGDGFFGIIGDNNEVFFTRDGAFSLDKDGNLVTSKGFKVYPGLTMPSNTVSVSVSENGLIEAFMNGQIDPVQVGTMPVFTFVNPNGLRSIGSNLMAQTRVSGEPQEQVAGKENAGVVMAGTLESSNVSIMNEMTNLIKAQRAYEMNSKVMGVADQMLQTVNQIR
jgi:flagellar basal-body rod protein FlgG